MNITMEGWTRTSWSKRKIRYKITIWPHPKIQGKYSYAIGVGHGVMGGGLGDAGTLHGEFPLPSEAMEAAIDELNDL